MKDLLQEVPYLLQGVLKRITRGIRICCNEVKKYCMRLKNFAMRLKKEVLAACLRPNITRGGPKVQAISEIMGYPLAPPVVEISETP